MNLYLEGKCVVITGAAGGIGGAVADAFASEKAELVLTDAADRVGDVAKKYSRNAVAIAADITSEAGRRSVVDKALAFRSGIDVLVNCAGVSKPLPYGEVDEGAWQEIMNVNANSLFQLTRLCLPEIEKRKGSVVSIASFAAKRATLFGNNLTYTVSKHAVVGITRALAFDVAAKGVRVNAVAPGPVMTEMVKTHSEEARKRIVGMIPAGRMADPGEVADLIVFLSSDRAAYINGEVVNINGGLYMD
jgi:3-oxoacyl-[acyl-carrier protein] reductase